MSPISKAIAWILLSSALFVAVTGVVRHLGSDMNAFQAAFIRYFIGSLFFVPVYVRLVRAGRYPAKVNLHVLRGVVHGIGVMLWFYAMARIPIADVTAIGFTAPIFTTLGAALFLGGWGITIAVVMTILAVGTLITFAQRLFYVHSVLRDADGPPEAS